MGRRPKGSLRPTRRELAAELPALAAAREAKRQHREIAALEAALDRRALEYGASDMFRACRDTDLRQYLWADVWRVARRGAKFEPDEAINDLAPHLVRGELDLDEVERKRESAQESVKSLESAVAMVDALRDRLRQAIPLRAALLPKDFADFLERALPDIAKDTLQRARREWDREFGKEGIPRKRVVHAARLAVSKLMPPWTVRVLADAPSRLLVLRRMLDELSTERRREQFRQAAASALMGSDMWQRRLRLLREQQRQRQRTHSAVDMANALVDARRHADSGPTESSNTTRRKSSR